MRRQSLLLLIPLLCATVPFNLLKAQQQPGDPPNYGVLALVFAGGAIGSYEIYRSIQTCPNSADDGGVPLPLPQPDQPNTECQHRANEKDVMLVVGIGCVAGFVWALSKAIHGSNFKTSALVNVSRGKRGTMRVPDFAYNAPRRDVRVLLLHATF